MPPDSSPNSHTAMKLSSPVFFPCKNPRYNTKLAYRQPPRCQKIKWSIYCWLSLDIMPIRYVIPRWFYRCLLFLHVGLQAIKVNWSSCINTLMTANCWIIKSWNHSASFYSLWTLLIVNKICLKFSQSFQVRRVKMSTPNRKRNLHDLKEKREIIDYAMKQS